MTVWHPGRPVEPPDPTSLERHALVARCNDLSAQLRDRNREIQDLHRRIEALERSLAALWP